MGYIGTPWCFSKFDHMFMNLNFCIRVHLNPSALLEICSDGVLFTLLLLVYAPLFLADCSLQSCRTKAPQFVTN